MLRKVVSPRDQSPYAPAAQSPHTPAKFVINAEKGVVFVRFGKKVTVEDIREYAARLVAHPSFNPSFSEIVDLSAPQELDLQANDFLKLADEIDPFSPSAKRAFVVKDSVQTHAARMHNILRADSNIRIFHSFQEAERWIYE